MNKNYTPKVLVASTGTPTLANYSYIIGRDEDWISPVIPKGYKFKEDRDHYKIYEKEIKTHFTINSMVGNRNQQPIPRTITGKKYFIYNTKTHEGKSEMTKNEMDVWIMQDMMELHEENN